MRCARGLRPLPCGGGRGGAIPQASRRRKALGSGTAIDGAAPVEASQSTKGPLWYLQLWFLVLVAMGSASPLATSIPSVLAQGFG
jgi:hypothetical protein